MAFKIKDLMINIAPAEAGEGQAGCRGKHTNIGGCTGKRTNALCSCTGKKTNPIWGTCRGKHTNPEGWWPGDPGEALEELSAVKAELQAALAEVDEEINEIEETLRPKTVAEVEELQTKLKEALEELDKIKAGLEKK